MMRLKSSMDRGRTAGAPRNLALLVEHGALDQPKRTVEWDRVGEVQVSAGFDQGEIDVLGGRVRHDMGHFGHREVSARVEILLGS